MWPIPLEFKGEQNAYSLAENRLNQVELGHRLHHYPGQLSGGRAAESGAGQSPWQLGPVCFLQTNPPVIWTREQEVE